MNNFLRWIRNRRWTKWLLGLFYLSAICGLYMLIKEEYIDVDMSSISNKDSGGVVFGISLVTEKPQTLLSNLSADKKDHDWSTSFLLQSRSPTVQVFVDYISIYDNAEQPIYCFTSFHLGKDINVPFQVISEIEENPINSEVETDDKTASDNSDIEDNRLGALESINNESSEYIFKLKDLPCLERGKKYFVPHLFLGIISSETYANLPLPSFPTITGYRALEFFPFEQQNITFDLSAHFTNNSGQYGIRPNLDISISQQGWIGKFEETGDKTVLNLSRPSFYQVILITFSLIMAILIMFLNNIIDPSDGFFEVAFGLLLGLWGTHEILIPEYIGTSVPIDVIIYLLYALVIGEIVAVFIDESLNNWIRHNVKIDYIEKGKFDKEYVEIENRSFFPINMTGWILFDQTINKFKFPVFVLRGRNIFSRKRIKTVKIWTKPGNNDEDNLYWGRKKDVWNSNQETAYLEDSKGISIDTYSYPKRRRDD